MRNDNEFEAVEKLQSDLSRLRTAYDLLYEVHLEHGPYGDKEISQELRFKINNFFGFDDSE